MLKITDVYRQVVIKGKNFLRNRAFVPESPGKGMECVLLTNNCLAGFLYKDWGMKFNSPTVNLQMKPEVFIRLCENLPESLDWEFEEIKIDDDEFYKKFESENHHFPVGRFKAGEVYFQHYDTFAEAMDCWRRRSERLKRWISENKEVNVVLVCDEVTPEEYESFCGLNFKNKLILQQVPADAKKDAAVMSNMRKGDDWYTYQHGFTVKRFYEQFGFAKWVKCYKK